MPDDTDRRILAELEKDSDRSQKTIASIVGLSEPTLSKRIGDLKELGVIKRVTIEIDYEKFGLNTTAFTVIKFRHHDTVQIRKLVDELCSNSKVREIYDVLGNWDMGIRWQCKNNSDLMDAIQSILKSNDNVDHLETFTFGTQLKSQWTCL